MARSDRRGVTAAQCSGVAARCCQHRKITEDEALEQIAAALRTAGYRAGTPDAVEVLTRAASTYAPTDADGPEAWFHPAAVALLVAAGADEAEAHRRRAVLDRRPTNFG